jgi:cell division protein FtsB
MWRKTIVTPVVIVLLAVLVYLAWRGIGLGPPETQAMSDQIAAANQQINQLQQEVKDLQAQVQAEQLRIDELESRVAGPK